MPKKDALAKGPPLLSPEKRDLFLERLAETGRVIESCYCVGVKYHHMLAHKKRDPDFQRDVDLAMLRYCDLIVKEVHRRAVDGVEEDVFNKDGDKVGTRRKYSNDLLRMLVQRHDPAFRQHVHVDHKVAGGVLVVNAQLPTSEWVQQNGAREIEG